MATPVIMPKLEMSQETATVVEWLKREGEYVEKGEPLLTIETDKVTIEIESPASGILAGVWVKPDQVVPVTEVIAYILQLGERLDESASQRVRAEQIVNRGSQIVDAPISSAPLPSRPSAPLSERVRATPAARRIARERGVPLATVRGSGPRGRIQVADVLAVVPQLAIASEPAAEVVPLRGIRRVIAEGMAASAQETARVTLVTEADATALVEAREQLRAAVTEKWGFAPGYSDLLGVIVARALREFPYMNARLKADPLTGTGGRAIERLSTVNLGVAVDTDRGLLVPVIRDADKKGLRAFGDEFRELVARARAGRSLPEDLTGGTFTITDLGMYEVDAFTPMINLPEAAILGVGRIQPKPAVREGEVVVRQVMTLSLAFDHRAVDGAPAARFLRRIKRLVEHPYLLLG